MRMFWRSLWSGVFAARSGSSSGLPASGPLALLAVICLVCPGVGAAEPAGYRQLAPGVLKVIPADSAMDDALRRGPLLEITEGQKGLAWTPRRAAPNTTFVELARRIEFPRDIWCLEFAFKPPRQIEVDVPAAADRMQRATLWYMVYRVKNVGGRRLLFGADAEGNADPTQRAVETFEKPVRFLPHFVFESRESLSEDEGLFSYRSYLDRLVPAAMDAIRLREDKARELLDSAAMSATDIKPGEERWGVAIWEAVDPRIDYFSIYIRGLTNAIRWRKRPDSTIGPDDPPGRHIEQTLESLRLDFWQPGSSDGKQPVSIAYRGMFERMTLGGRVLAALGWPARVKAQPTVGLERLGLAWNAPGLVEPAGDGPATSLKPLATVFASLAAVADRQARADAARQLFGDVGMEAIKDLAAAATGPVEADQEVARRQALEKLKMTPKAVAAAPLDALAKIVSELDAAPDAAARAMQARAIFGPAARRIEWLRRGVINARALAAIDATSADPVAIAKLDARGAFEALAAAVGSTSAEQQEALAAALFGPGGPELFKEAVADHEGIDYSWVCRYENTE